MQNSTVVITSSMSYDNRKIRSSLPFDEEASARVFEALSPYANEDFCPIDFDALPRDDSELNTPDDSPPPSSPASSPSLVPERCSSDPSVSSGNQDQDVSPALDSDDMMAELLLYVKRTDIVNCDSALESKFFDALRPKELTPQKKVLKYEFVSHTCEEHRKKHLRCPFNCKGRVVSRVPRLVSENQQSEMLSNDDLELEGQTMSPSYSPKSRLSSRSSSFSFTVEKDAMDTDDEDYSIESPKSKQRSKEAKKKTIKNNVCRILQSSFREDIPNRAMNEKLEKEKDRIKKDREERVRARRIASIRESLKALEHAYDEDSDVERVLVHEQVQWLQDDKLFQEQNEKIINGKKKPFGTKNSNEIANDSSSLFSGLSVAVNSNAVQSTSSYADDSKGRRWVRFACERHRKEHAKCPENCANRVKHELSMACADAERRDPQSHIMGISST